MSTTNILREYDLGTKLDNAQKYVINRYNYYNDEQSKNNSCDAIKQTIDDIRNKMLVSHFINAKKIEKYFTKNFMNKVIKSSLISGCAFARVVKINDDEMELIPYDAYFATGVLNNDNTLSSAITIDETDSNGNPTIITTYTKDKIITSYPGDKKKEDKEETNTFGVIPVVPIIVNQNALKPFGDSFITKKMMSQTNKLKNTMERAEHVEETLAEANTFLLGVSQDLESELDDKTLNLLKNVVTITQDADGKTPTVATRENGASQLEQKIKDLEDSIKYDTTTKAYADMIESIRDDLVASFNLIGDLIIKVYNNDATKKLTGELDIVFKNNDFSEFSAFMDGVLKVNQVIPGYLQYEQMDKILGIKGNKPKLLDAIKEDIKRDVSASQETTLGGAKTGPQKMYAAKSVIKDYQNERITETQAIHMMELAGYEKEEAKQFLLGGDGD